MLGIAIVVHLASWPVVLVVSVIEGSASAIFNPAATDAVSYAASFGTVSRIRGRFRPTRTAERVPAK